MNVQLTYNNQQITLTEEQSTAYTAIFDWIDGESSFNVIQGSPGTGKTFLMTLALKQALEERPSLNVAVGTPTHKAKSVIKEYLASQGIELACFTVHSLLGIGQDIDEDTGKKVFKKSKQELPIHEYDLIWIDEFSMLNKSLFDSLLANAKSLLFTGDIRQLLPVNEDSFPVWEYCEKCGIKPYILSEPQRYSGTIKDAVYGLIDYIDNAQVVNYWDICPALDEQMLFTKDLVDDYLSTDWQNGNSVILAYKNITIDKLNRSVRDTIYGHKGKEPLLLQPGEKCLTYAPINDIGGCQVANNGTMLTVSYLEPSKLELNDASFDAHRYYFKEIPTPVLRVAESDTENWLSYLTGLRQKAKKGQIKWGQYYRTESMSQAFKPMYALTIHKSQGSGYNDVFLLDDFGGWMKDGAMQPRLYYVAISRAKERFTYCTRL